MRGAGQDGAAQPMLMLDVGRVGGPHGQESGRWVGRARPSAVRAAVGPYRATVARVSSKFSYRVTAGNGTDRMVAKDAPDGEQRKRSIAASFY